MTMNTKLKVYLRFAIPIAIICLILVTWVWRRTPRKDVNFTYRDTLYSSLRQQNQIDLPSAAKNDLQLEEISKRKKEMSVFRRMCQVKSSKESLKDLFPDPSVVLNNYHKNAINMDNDLKPHFKVDTANYIFKEAELTYELPTKNNIAFSSLFGLTRYVTMRDLQQLLLGAIKTFRDPTKGNWRGSIIIITDKPRFVRRMLHENREFLNCNPSLYDPIPSVYTNPEDGINDCMVSVSYEPEYTNNLLAYKLVKSRMLKVLERENGLRIQENLPVLDYIFYRDVDIWSWADTQSLINHLAENYKGHEVAIWDQPGANFEARGEILHGGIWMVHRELSYYWLRLWTMFMFMLTPQGQLRDQVSLGMTAFAHGWDYKGTDESRKRVGYSVDLLQIPFGRLYPLEFKDQNEWKNGVFLHWTGRSRYPEDSAAFAECSKDIGLENAVLLPYFNEDEDHPKADIDDEINVLLRDNHGDAMDVVYKVDQVSCITKQVVQHINKFLQPRRIFLIVPSLQDCGETVFFAPNIYCFVKEYIIPYKPLLEILGEDIRIFENSILPVFISINIGWSKLITENYLYLDENVIPINHLFVSNLHDPSRPIVLRKADSLDNQLIEHFIGTHAYEGEFIGSSIISVNRKQVGDMMHHISHRLNVQGLYNFAEYLKKFLSTNKKIRNELRSRSFFHSLYYGFLATQGKISADNTRIWSRVKLDQENSVIQSITRKISGKCLSSQFMRNMQCYGIDILIHTK